MNIARIESLFFSPDPRVALTSRAALATGQRLPVTGPDGTAGGDFVRLGTVRVTSQP